MSAVSSVTFFLSLSLVAGPINGFPMHADGKILPRIEIEDMIGREYDKISSCPLNFLHYYKIFIFSAVIFLYTYIFIQDFSELIRNAKIIVYYL